MAEQSSKAPPASPQIEATPLPLDRATAWFRGLLEQVAQLHRAGQMHAAIVEANLTRDAQGQPVLSKPASHVVLDSGAAAETCPPELGGKSSWALPTDLAAASVVLANAGAAIDPRRIDVYQLGVLLCRRLTGLSVAAYLRSPKARMLVPLALRPAVDGALGFEADHRWLDCDQLAVALEQAAANVQSESPDETPATGVYRPPAVDTPPQGSPQAVSDSSPDVAAAPPPETLGAYRILERIGGGGMGDVYKAYDQALDRVVAVKVLPPELARHAEFVRRFRTEATAIAKLLHPNIVQIFACGEDSGRHFFAMQFVEGESLAELLRRRERLSVAEALPIIEQCLAGLAAAHERDLIHRDIKPGNILLDREHGRALVADFGLVKTADGSEKLTATGIIMGTVDYIPPEQARGQKVDRRSDLYSLGALMYQMLSGRLPFISDSPTGMIFQHAYEQPTPLADLVPGVPRQIAALVMRLLAKNPQHRYQCAEDVLADIQAFRDGRPPVSAAATGDKSTSKLVTAPDLAALEPIPLLPRQLGALAHRGWRGKLWELFHTHTPQIAKHLLDTQQQVDGAVLEYEQRRNQLANLVWEATAVAADFAAQAASHRAAAAAAAERADSAAGPEIAAQAERDRQECLRVAAEFASQCAEQQDQLETIRLRLAKVDATLKQLRSQRDILHARLQAAEAQLGSPALGGSRLRKPVVRLAIAAAVLLAGVIGLRYVRMGASTVVLLDTQILGGGGGGNFRDVTVWPGLLTGFEATTCDFSGHRVIRSIRPTYRNDNQTTHGKTYGFPSGEVFKIEAKDGYAVGGLVARSGYRVDGFKLIFMRHKGTALDPNDSYESPWIGGRDSAAENVLGGDGRPVVGILGRSGADLDAIGLVQSGLPGSGGSAPPRAVAPRSALPVGAALGNASLVGRATVKGQDIGLVVNYWTGRRLKGSLVRQFILEHGYKMDEVEIALRGKVHVGSAASVTAPRPRSRPLQVIETNDYVPTGKQFVLSSTDKTPPQLPLKFTLESAQWVEMAHWTHLPKLELYGTLINMSNKSVRPQVYVSAYDKNGKLVGRDKFNTDPPTVEPGGQSYIAGKDPGSLITNGKKPATLEYEVILPVWDHSLPATQPLQEIAQVIAPLATGSVQVTELTEDVPGGEFALKFKDATSPHLPLKLKIENVNWVPRANWTHIPQLEIYGTLSNLSTKALQPVVYVTAYDKDGQLVGRTRMFTDPPIIKADDEGFISGKGAGSLISFGKPATLEYMVTLPDFDGTFPAWRPGEHSSALVVAAASEPASPAINVAVWHRGGTSDGGVHTLYVDDREIGSVGDDRTKDATYSLFLAPGDHQIKWLLSGGQLGDDNLLEFFDAETRQPLAIAAESDAAAAVNGQPTQLEIDNGASTREAEFPLLP